MNAKQLQLVAGTWTKDRFAFGGTLLKRSHAKGKRPFSPKLALHVVLRSEQARGSQSLLRHGSRIARVLEGQAERHGVRLYSVSNAGNHLHLLLRAASSAHLSAFLRAVTGRVAQIARGESKERQARGFWDQRPFSRLVAPGRDFRQVAGYLSLNATESSLAMRRGDARTMFDEIRELLRRGLLPVSPSLRAAGF